MPGGQMYQIAVQAVGEVRDADGNLISSEPVEATLNVTEDELKEFGLTPPEGENQ